MNKVRKLATDDEMIRFHVYLAEKAQRIIYPACSNIMKRDISNAFIIMDVKGRKTFTGSKVANYIM